MHFWIVLRWHCALIYLNCPKPTKEYLSEIPPILIWMHLIRIFIKRAFGFSKALFLLFYHLVGIVVLKNVCGNLFYLSSTTRPRSPTRSPVILRGGATGLGGAGRPAPFDKGDNFVTKVPPLGRLFVELGGVFAPNYSQQPPSTPPVGLRGGSPTSPREGFLSLRVFTSFT